MDKEVLRRYYKCTLRDENGYDDGDRVEVPATDPTANLVGSLASLQTEEILLMPGDLRAVHYPVLDIDIPHRYVPSSTEGHGHIYFDVPITWQLYKELLGVLRRCGIIEEGYCNAALSRGQTFVRLPHVKKGME